ncbi:MAG: isopenicillin N synthase family dioxygenase [Burkholderiales bacterium]
MADLMNSQEVESLDDFVNRGERDVARAAVSNLPTIDISPFLREASRQDRARVAAQLREACINIGFFYMTGHGISPAAFEEEIAWGHRFFEQPLEEKMKVHKSLAASNLGFMNVGGVNPELNQDKEADLKETFTFNRNPMPGEPQGYRMGVGESQWPKKPALAGFEPFMMGQLENRVRLAQSLLRAFALSLELAEDYFDASHRFIGCNFTFNYYPAMDPARAKRTQWGISPHTDYGSFTLLSQDSLGGLEVRNANGEWIAVPPVAGALVVNIGDLFARWTNDLYTSNFHRAVNYNPQGKARISVPFFVYPHASVAIDCLPSCQSLDNPPRYESVNAVEYVRSLIKRSYETGRPGVARESVSRLSKR